MIATPLWPSPTLAAWLCCEVSTGRQEGLAEALQLTKQRTAATAGQEAVLSVQTGLAERQ